MNDMTLSRCIEKRVRVHTATLTLWDKEPVPYSVAAEISFSSLSRIAPSTVEMFSL